jgi:Tfp pilus assembly protein PilO
MTASRIPAPAPSVQISWGELLDKITILEIKAQRLKSQAAIEKTQRQLAKLSSAVKDMLRQQPRLTSLKEQLKSLNKTPWDFEDKIRAKEAAKSFDQEFIELARSVYINNDKKRKSRAAD